MEDPRRGQVNRSAADVYEEFFVPAIFCQSVRPIVKAAGIDPGARVLDVACGTGVLAREAYRRASPGGCVVGLDINEGMLAVAARVEPNIDWLHGAAEALPFGDASFDAVISQFGLMFFDDKVAALKEMWRVLRPGGRLVVAVWDRLENSPGYADMVDLLDRIFGSEAADALTAPFILGDPDTLLDLFARAGIEGTQLRPLKQLAEFPSIDDWVHTDVKGWTLADMIDDDQFELLRLRANNELRQYEQSDGTVEFSNPALMVSATKPG